MAFQSNGEMSCLNLLELPAEIGFFVRDGLKIYLTTFDFVKRLLKTCIHSALFCSHLAVNDAVLFGFL